MIMLINIKYNLSLWKQIYSLCRCNGLSPTDQAVRMQNSCEILI